MDLTPSIIPKSDQINADEIMAPVTYTIREVKAGSVEQPFDFMLVETDRAYRPSKTMRRVIVNAWGPEAANYAGRRLTLYREPTIKYAGVEVGGIRISHMSHIEGPVEVMAQTTRGKREKFTVQPLALESAVLPASPADATGAGREPSTPVAPEAAQNRGTQPAVATGQLRVALAALTAYQKGTLFAYCGLKTDEPTPLKEIRAAMVEQWTRLGLPPFEGEPVPVTLLGAIYEQQRQERDPSIGAEAFQHELDTGQSLDPGDQAALA